MKGKKTKLGCQPQKSMFTKKQMEQMDKLYSSDDKFDKMAEQGIHSPYEVELMRKGKYRKL